MFFNVFLFVWENVVVDLGYLKKICQRGRSFGLISKRPLLSWYELLLSLTNISYR